MGNGWRNMLQGLKVGEVDDPQIWRNRTDWRLCCFCGNSFLLPM